MKRTSGETLLHPCCWRLDDETQKLVQDVPILIGMVVFMNWRRQTLSGAVSSIEPQPCGLMIEFGSTDDGYTGPTGEPHELFVDECAAQFARDVKRESRAPRADRAKAIARRPVEPPLPPMAMPNELEAVRRHGQRLLRDRCVDVATIDGLVKAIERVCAAAASQDEALTIACRHHWVDEVLKAHPTCWLVCGRTRVRRVPIAIGMEVFVHRRGKKRVGPAYVEAITDGEILCSLGDDANGEIRATADELLATGKAELPTEIS